MRSEIEPSAFVAVLVALACCGAWAQTFEVATVNPSPPPGPARTEYRHLDLLNFLVERFKLRVHRDHAEAVPTRN